MKQQEGDSKKRIAFPIQLFAEGSADGQTVGKQDHPAYGEMETKSERIEALMKQFDEHVRQNVVILTVYDHHNGISGAELPMHLL